MKCNLQQILTLTVALACLCGRTDAQENAARITQDDVRQLHAVVESLRAEVSLLRKALRRIERDRHRENIRQIKAEIESANAERARLDDVERTRQQELREIDELLVRNESAAAERLDLESARSDLSVARAKEIADVRETVRVRESDLLRRLQTEEEAVRKLDELLKSTKGESQ